MSSLGDRNAGVLLYLFELFQLFSISLHYFLQKGQRESSLLKKKIQRKAKTHDPSLTGSREVNPSLSLGFSRGFREVAGGKGSSYRTHPDQTLKSLPKNLATANYVSPGLHLCREGAG